MFERSEFGASRLTRAPQGIRPFGPDGGLGDSVFAYFFRRKSKAHQPAKLAAQLPLNLNQHHHQLSEAGGATPLKFDFKGNNRLKTADWR